MHSWLSAAFYLVNWKMSSTGCTLGPSRICYSSQAAKEEKGRNQRRDSNKTKGEGSEPADDAAKAVPRVQHALPQTELPLAVAALLRRHNRRRVCLLLQRAEPVPQR